MSAAHRCPFCHRAVYTSGTGEIALRAAMFMHLVRCDERPADASNEQLAVIADECVAQALAAIDP